MNRLAKPLLITGLTALALLGSAGCSGRHGVAVQADRSEAPARPAAPAASAAPPKTGVEQDHQPLGDRDLGPGAKKETLGSPTGR